MSERRAQLLALVVLALLAFDYADRSGLLEKWSPPRARAEAAVLAPRFIPSVEPETPRGAPTGSPVEAAPAPVWYDDLDEATAVADGRPVLAFFTFDTCRACRVLRDNVLSQDEFLSAVSDHVVLCRVDIQSRDYRRKYRSRFGITSAPFLVLCEEGRPVGTSLRYLPSLEVVVDWLNNYLNERSILQGRAA